MFKKKKEEVKDEPVEDHSPYWEMELKFSPRYYDQYARKWVEAGWQGSIKYMEWNRYHSSYSGYSLYPSWNPTISEVKSNVDPDILIEWLTKWPNEFKELSEYVSGKAFYLKFPGVL